MIPIRTYKHFCPVCSYYTIDERSQADCPHGHGRMKSGDYFPEPVPAWKLK